MQGSTVEQGKVPSAEVVAEIRGHTKATRMLEAWEIAKEYDHPSSWAAGEPRFAASLLLDNLGASREARILDWRNLRACPEDPKVFLRGQFARMPYAGVAAVLKGCEECLDERADLPDKRRADLLALVGALYGSFRDFERAFRFIGQALELVEDDSWIHVQKAAVLEYADRYEEALESARHGVALRPFYRPAVLALERCLVHLGRDEEGEEVVRNAHEGSQLANYPGRLMIYYRERGDHEKGLWSLDEFERLSPLADRECRDWLAARRADFHYMAGRIEESIRCSKEIKEGKFYEKVRERLGEPETALRKRRMLEVPFVRQHNMTCAPATLAAIARFWGHDHDHVAIAEVICHDGTPWHKERHWAEGAGYLVREFRVTREAAIELIERGVPFTLTTSWTTSGHLQACTGYDERMGVLLLRDPTHRYFGEILIEGLIEDHPVEGPRGMVMVPEDRRDLLDGLTLPDEALYHARSEMALALDKHDRLAALTAVTTMRAIQADHPLTAMAERQLADYDRDWLEEVRICEELSTRFPKNQPLKYSLLLSLRRLGRRERRLEILDDLVGRKDSDPVFYSELGELIAEDARESEMAEYYLRKAVRLRSSEGRTFASLAWCYWKQRRFEEARACRRLACCLAPGFEPYAREFFEASVSLGEREEGLDFLRARVSGTASRHSGPWMTLIDGLEKLGRDDQAKETMEEGLRALPDDGDLRLAASRKFLGWGEVERARELLDSARGKVDEAVWLMEAAVQASFLGKRRLAIQYRRLVLEQIPHHVNSHAALARLLAEEEGRGAALRHLAAAWEAHPDDADLLELYAEWIEQDGPEKSIPLLEQALSMRPHSVWTRRELACEYLRAGETSEAERYARRALVQDPQDVVSNYILGWVLENAHQLEEAADYFRATIRLDVDHTQAAAGLMRISANNREAVANLTFLHEEMERQVSRGAVVPLYRDYAHSFLDTKHVLAQLEKFCEERPDLSETWIALKDQGLDMGRAEVAERAVKELSERFPLIAGTWMEVAEVHHKAGELDREIEALQKAVDLSPAWDQPARRLADALELQGRYDEAVRMLERAIDWEPLTAQNHGCLASLLWRMGREGEAFERLTHCLKINSGYPWGWATIGEWGAILERREEVEELIALHRERKAGDVDWWLCCIDAYEGLGEREKALEANAAGREVDARNVDLIDNRAYLLCLLNRPEEALELLAGVKEAGLDSRRLEGRRGWVLMEGGQPVEAIRVMQELGAREPDYAWVHRQLVEWHSERNELKELRKAARHLVRLQPSNSSAWGYLAEAAKNLEDKVEAREAYAKAFTLDPHYSHAGRNLLDYLLEEKEFEEAGRVVATLEHYSPSLWIKIDGMDVALARGDEEEFTRRLEEVLRSEEAQADHLNYVASLYQKTQRMAEWEALLNERARREDASRAVLGGWSRQMCGKNRLGKAIRRLERFKGEGTTTCSGWAVVLRALEEKKDSKAYLKLIKKHRALFRSDGETLSAGAEGLVEFQEYLMTREWFGDWQQQVEALSSGDYINLAVAIDDTDGRQSSRELREAALKAFPADHHASYHRAALAFVYAEAGNPEVAAQHLAQVERERISIYYKVLAHLAGAMVAGSGADEEAAMKELRNAQAAHPALQNDTELLPLTVSVAKQLAPQLPFANGKAKRILKRLNLRAKAGATTSLGTWLVLAILGLYAVVKIITIVIEGV